MVIRDENLRASERRQNVMHQLAHEFGFIGEFNWVPEPLLIGMKSEQMEGYYRKRLLGGCVDEEDVIFVKP